jgi:hypothetical protein
MKKTQVLPQSSEQANGVDWLTPFAAPVLDDESEI